MAAELAVDRFLDLLSRSHLVSDEQMQEFAEEFGSAESLLTESQKIAEELVAREVLTPWQADMLLQGKYRGFILGSYRILKPLGKGGMGTVFLAEHLRMRRRCAIKVLPSDHSRRESSMLERFDREAQAVAKLDHPNIVRAYDISCSVENNREIHYLVMEHVDGRNLQQLVQKNGVLGYRETADLIRQAAEGLAHAHHAGFVHRDVKPANLLLDSKGVVKVLDLGLAMFFEDAAEEAGLTNQAHDRVLGTADYLAPEQALDSHNIDARADIYSLGMTFYFLLAGHPPFPKGTVAQRLLAHQKKEPVPIDELRPDAPLSLLAILKKMIAKEPAARYQKAEDVAAALAEWLRDHADGGSFIQRQTRLASDTRFGLSSRTSPTHHTADHSVETDLELAPLDEEPKSWPNDIRLPGSSGSLSGSGLKLPGSSVRLPGSSSKLPGATDSQAGASQSGSSASRSDALAAPFSNVPVTPPPEATDADESEEGEEYHLAGEASNVAGPRKQPPSVPRPTLLDEDLLSAPMPTTPPLPGLPTDIPPRYMRHGASDRRNSLSAILESGVFWIAVAVVLVLTLIIAIMVSVP